MGAPRTWLASAAVVVVVVGCWTILSQRGEQVGVSVARQHHRRQRQHESDERQSQGSEPAHEQAPLTPEHLLPNLYTPPPLSVLPAATDLQVPTQVAGMGITHRERFRGDVHLGWDWHRGWSMPLYLPELNTLLCTHAKAGCTTLRSYVLMWSGDLDAPDGRAHRILFRERTFNRTYIEVVRDHNRASKLLSDPDVMRVAFVREPIARVVSMFINKLIANNDNEMKASGAKRGADRKTIFFRPRDLKLLDYGIHKFIEGLWNWRNHLKDCRYDEHLTLQSCRCAHRFVDYDFVGRTERLDEDVEEWLRMRGRPDLIPKKQPMNTSNGTLSETLLKALTKEDIQRLWEIYEEDYVRFGYPDPRTKFAAAATEEAATATSSTS